MDNATPSVGSAQNTLQMRLKFGRHQKLGTDLNRYVRSFLQYTLTSSPGHPPCTTRIDLRKHIYFVPSRSVELDADSLVLVHRCQIPVKHSTDQAWHKLKYYAGVLDLLRSPVSSSGNNLWAFLLAGTRSKPSRLHKKVTDWSHMHDATPMSPPCKYKVTPVAQL